MTKIHKDNLRFQTPFIVDNIEVDPVLSILHAKFVIDETDMQNIEEERTLRKQAKKLLATLGRKSDYAYLAFIRALEETGQDHVAKLLQGTPIFLFTRYA